MKASTRSEVKAAAAAIFAVSLVWAGGGSAGQVTAEPETPPGKAGRTGPLAKLPSPPGPHVARIQALGDEAWLDLGRPKPDPKWGQSRGRAWCAHMDYAGELRGAFHTGEGVHAFVKPDGHYMDDFFFYDINAHAWICVYGGAKAGDDQGFKIDPDGFFVNRPGDAIPVGLLAHNYEQVAYDPHRHKLAFIPKGGASGWWCKMKLHQVKKLAPEANRRMKGKAFSPWFLDATTGKFQREIISSPGPISTAGGGAFVYLVGSRKFFLRDPGRGRNWLYDPHKRTWARAADCPKRPIGGDTLCCYDSKRNRVLLAGGNAKGADGLLAYLPGEDKWLDLQPKGGGRPCTGNWGSLTYDSANDVLVLARRGQGLFIYDPRTNAWLNDKPKAGPGVLARGTASAFYDPVNNVHYFYRASDSRTNSTMWVYRYKRR